MTNLAGRPEPAIIEHLAAVLRTLVDLLRSGGETSKADWIAERLAVVDQEASSAAISTAMRELHGVVLGMGGLMDMYLSAGSEEESSVANRELRRLADQLYELTR